MNKEQKNWINEATKREEQKWDAAPTTSFTRVSHCWAELPATDLGRATTAAAAAAAGVSLGTCVRLCMKAVCSGAALVDNSVHTDRVRLMSRVQINTRRSRPWFAAVVYQ